MSDDKQEQLLALATGQPGQISDRDCRNMIGELERAVRTADRWPAERLAELRAVAYQIPADPAVFEDPSPVVDSADPVGQMDRVTEVRLHEDGTISLYLEGVGSSVAQNNYDLDEARSIMAALGHFIWLVENES